MIKVKTFTSQLKMFQTMRELDELDGAVNDYIAAHGIRSVVSVSDAVTAGQGGGAIGIIRVLAYDDPSTGARDRYVERIEKSLQEWGTEIDALRARADRLGADARGKLQEQVRDLRVRQEDAAQKLAELRKAGGDAWEDVKAHAESAVDELRKGVEAAIDRLRKK